jgi:hypothetical protein
MEGPKHGEDRMQHTGKRQHFAALICIALMMSGCGGDDDAPATQASSPSSPAPPPQGSALPSITGSPYTMARVDQTYTFQPTASSPNGSSNLTFSISSKPRWATFDSSNGRLSGKPAGADLGTYSGITITVSDSAGSRSLSPFSIHVVEFGNQSVTLSWLPPTENADGTPLTDLAGYKIRYGQEPRSYETVINVSSAGLTTYVVEGLVPSTYHFTISAYRATGAESDFSNEAVVSLGDI